MKIVKISAFGVNPVNSFERLRFAAGGNKFSYLVCYRFDNGLKLAYCAKLRSKIFRKNLTDLSRWYMWEDIEGGVRVLNYRDTLDKYKFDVKNFFASKTFTKHISLFENAINKGLASAKENLLPKIEERLSQIEDKSNKSELYFKLNEMKRLVKVYINTISNALDIIGDGTFEDKTYELRNLDLNVNKPSKIKNEFTVDDAKKLIGFEKWFRKQATKDNERYSKKAIDNIDNAINNEDS